MANPLDQLVLGSPVAKGLAQPGGVHNPILRYLAGLPPAGGGDASSPPASPPPAPVRHPRRRAPGPDVSTMQSVMARFKTADETGFARPEWTIERQGDAIGMSGYLPAEAALRPEAYKNLRAQGLDPSMIDVSNMTPAEANYIRMVLNPEWINRQLDPGSSLSDAEKADALKKANGG